MKSAHFVSGDDVPILVNHINQEMYVVFEGTTETLSKPLAVMMSRFVVRQVNAVRIVNRPAISNVKSISGHCIATKRRVLRFRNATQLCNVPLLPQVGWAGKVAGGRHLTFLREVKSSPALQPL